jgi:hypothetical protein
MVVRLDDSDARRDELVGRLVAARCAVDRSNAKYLRAGSFDAALG